MTPPAFIPIGVYNSLAKYPYDVPRQGTLAQQASGIVTLEPQRNFEQALKELEGFSHIWLIFWFHHNQNWTPMTRPPRHRDKKVGVFASRSPYRPNPIGLSAVRLVSVDGLQLAVQDCDLLDGTPILDIKPYLPFADSFPNATTGWTAQDDSPTCTVDFSPLAAKQAEWLEAHGVPCIRQFILDRLEFEPENPSRHRLLHLNGQLCLAYRTWRIAFIMQAPNLVRVVQILSGYAPDDLKQSEDKYGDFAIHRAFLNTDFHAT